MRFAWQIPDILFFLPIFSYSESDIGRVRFCCIIRHGTNGNTLIRSRENKLILILVLVIAAQKVLRHHQRGSMRRNLTINKLLHECTASSVRTLDDSDGFPQMNIETLPLHLFPPHHFPSRPQPLRSSEFSSIRLYFALKILPLYGKIHAA